MTLVGRVESLWRYPVKSMRGEELAQLYAGFAGVYCDRLFAFHSPASRKGLPFLTAREQRRMLAFRPRFRFPERTVSPPNLSEADGLGVGATPVYADETDLALDVETPEGRTFAIDDPALIEMLRAGVNEGPQLSLIRSERALTDCRPVSLIGLQSVQRLGEECGRALDKRRFRANIYLDLTSAEPFGEDRYVGRSMRIGARTTLAIMHRDSRCMIITLDPETGEKDPSILKPVAQKHEGFAGVYAVVLVAGIIAPGDTVELLD